MTQDLKVLVASLQQENARLRQQVNDLQEKLKSAAAAASASASPVNLSAATNHTATKPKDASSVAVAVAVAKPSSTICCEFTKAQLERYGRQVLVQSFSIQAQRKLIQSKVLVIGAGGLGCPVLLYLAAMGVGTLGIVDNDLVDVTNLHRQIAHDSPSVGTAKVASAQRKIQQLNPLVHTIGFATRFTWHNAVDITQDFDVVIDASDNPQTRYLVSDVCVFLGKPLVSGSAIGMEGQLTVLNYLDAPCYRCIYPQPEQKAMSCADNGVLGVVPGIIGTLQAMECVKVITGIGQPLTGIQCLYDAYDGSFHRFKLPSRNPHCAACGPMRDRTRPVALHEFLASVHPEDTQTVCASSMVPAALAPENELGIETFASWRTLQKPYRLLDVRPTRQFDIVHFPEAVNYPLSEMKKQPDQIQATMHELFGTKSKVEPGQDDQPVEDAPLLVICRRGISSVRATQLLLELGLKNTSRIYNVQGGYTLFATQVDDTMPMY